MADIVQRNGLQAQTIALLILLACATPARAATWRVPTDQPTAAAALGVAAAGDTVLLAAGVYAEHGLVIGGGVTLRGATGAAADVILDGGGQGRVLDCAASALPARIEGLTIRGGRVTEGWFEALGGGVRCVDAILAASACVFAENTARLGGGLGALRARVELTDCTFASNAAAHAEWAAGGAAWCRESSGFALRCRFADNTAFSQDPADPGDAGALFCNATGLRLTDCDFERNRTGAGAGAFYSVNLDSTALERCAFSANEAAWGGAVYLEHDARATFADCDFHGNVARAGGAVLVGSGSTPTFTACLFADNDASGYAGGALEASDSAVSFRACTFRDNTAATYGGGVGASRAAVACVDCLFFGNAAALGGGAAGVDWTALSLEGCSLLGNAAPEGGGVDLGSRCDATLRRCLIAFSSAGGSIAGADSNAVSIACCDFFGNAGGDWEGALALSAGADGNLAADPLLCDGAGAAPADGRIAAVSPCAPEWSGGCGLIGAGAPGCGVAATGGGAAAPAVARLAVAPNPGNPRVTVSFELREPARVAVDVHDLLGRRVRRLLDAELAAGPHARAWDGRDDRGAPCAAGAYLCRVITPGGTCARALMLVR